MTKESKKFYFNNEVIISNIDNPDFLLKEFIKLSKKILYSMQEFKKTPSEIKKEMLSYNFYKAISHTKTCKTPNYLRFKLNVSKNIFAYWQTIILNNYYQCWTIIGKEKRKMKSLEPRETHYFDNYDFEFELTEPLDYNSSDVIVQDDYMRRAIELNII